jgi:hypothetical protein
LFGDVSEKGDIAGSDYKPYFDKILRDEWAPHAKAYKEILKEEKRVKSKPYGLADGGIAGMLGEPTYADGGRIGFKGKKFDPKRRGFLKLAAGLASIPFFGKYFKWAKPLAKTKVVDLTSVPIGSAEGMPAWFKPLVNKVIKEGDDVTKKFATKDREIVHTKKLGDPKDKFADEVTVTQDLETGNVRVEYNAAHNMGEAPIQLDYKAGEVIEYGSKKGTKSKPQFSAVESEPRVTNWDGDIEFDGENIVTKVDDLLTDTTKLESYATGKNPPIKKLLKSEQKKKYVNKLNDDQMEQIEYIDNKTGHLAPESLMDEPLPDDYPFASGGRVPLAGGLSTEWDNVPPVKMPDPFEKIWEKMTPEEKEIHKMQMEIMKRGFEIDPYEGMSEEEIEFMKNQRKIRERQRKDRGLPEWIQLMNQGGLAGMLGE